MVKVFYTKSKYIRNLDEYNLVFNIFVRLVVKLFHFPN